MKKMTLATLRNKISRFVFVSNSILYVLVFVFYAMSGFDEDELLTLIALLTPLTAIYLGSMIKFVVENRFRIENTEHAVKVSKSYISVTTAIIYSHFIILILAISAKALFNFISFNDLKIVFTAVEGLFGTYSGLISTSLFKADDANQ